MFDATSNRAVAGTAQQAQSDSSDACSMYDSDGSSSEHSESSEDDFQGRRSDAKAGVGKKGGRTGGSGAKGASKRGQKRQRAKRFGIAFSCLTACLIEQLCMLTVDNISVFWQVPHKTTVLAHERVIQCRFEGSSSWKSYCCNRDYVTM